jgi:hypothetical protein
VPGAPEPVKSAPARQAPAARPPGLGEDSPVRAIVVDKRVGGRYPLAAAVAQEDLAARRTTGKLLLRSG